MLLWSHSQIQANSSVSTTNRQLTLVAGNNRLSQLAIGTTSYSYSYDAAGNLTQENTERYFEWDQSDRMRVFRVQPSGAPPSLYAQYLYDSAGQRVMKLVRDQSGGYETTIYIDDAFEHQRNVTAAKNVENNSLHVMDNQKRIALVRVGDALPGDGAPDKKIKYQMGDHLGSSNVVVDDAGALISREEYLPYGETSFGSFARKRYRFTGKERDDESGLYYHGARYYAPWLAKWISADPEGPADGINLFSYARNNPLRFTDPSGRMSTAEAAAYVAKMKARGLQLPSEQPGSWAKVLTNTPSSLAIDCTKGAPFERIMTAKGTIRDAQFVSTLVLGIFGGFLAVEIVPLLAAPMGVLGSFESGTSVGQAATGKHWLTGEKLDLRERVESGISGGIGFLALAAGAVGRGGTKNVEVFGRGSATQSKIGGNLREFPLRAELAEGAQWVGKGGTGKPKSSNTLGFERGSLFSALHERFPNLFPAKGNPVVTPEIVEKFPEFEPYMGEKLIEHHIGHGDLTYPVPESIHKGSSTYLHGTGRNVGAAAGRQMGNIPARPGDHL
jgi:RHS repeat-associated protein